ncbi:MAG: pyridoxine 5'-phosphate synthase [Deltaproteobacteria bacterium]|nr:pyridoxine 5'-phosphate synthase [Deltaproteobacteria bacterium]
MTRVRLGVNVDHVATLRQARGVRFPDPVAAALLAESAGADQITVHLREDRRHIQERDLRVLRETVQTRLNLECAAADEVLSIACKVRPDEATLVPELREELTTEGGLDVVGGGARLAEAVARLKEAGIMVSLFIDPDPAQIEASARLEVEAIELHSGTYCDATTAAAREAELTRVEEGAALGARLGLMVAAGHGLTLQNVEPIVAIPQIEELNIGHSIVARALFVGFEEAVAEMRELLFRDD